MYTGVLRASMYVRWLHVWCTHGPKMASELLELELLIVVSGCCKLNQVPPEEQPLFLNIEPSL